MKTAPPALKLTVGALITAVALVGAVFAFAGTALLPSFIYDPGVKVRAQFTDSLALSPQADVTVAGVRVGKVESVAPDGAGSVIVMRIKKKNLKLSRDATAQIKSASILGSKYVNLTLGTPNSERLPGNFIPVSQTTVPFDIEQFFQVFTDFATGPLKRSLTQQTTILKGSERDLRAMIDNLNGVLKNGTATLKGNEQELRDLVDGLNRTMIVLRQRTTTLQSLLTQASDLFDLLTTKQQQIRQLAETQDQFFTTVNARRGDLTNLIDELDTNVRLLDQKRTQITDLLDKGSAAFKALNGATPDLKRVVRGLDDTTRSLALDKDQFVEQTKQIRTFRDSFGDAQAQGDFWTLHNRAPFGLSIGVLFETLRTLGINLPPEVTGPLSGGNGGGQGPGPQPPPPGNGSTTTSSAPAPAPSGSAAPAAPAVPGVTP